MARDIDIKIDKGILNLDKTARKGVVNGLKEIGDLVQNEAKKTTSFIDRSTAGLRPSILRQPVNKKELSVTVIAGMEYGIFVNDGTRYIKPRRFMEEGGEKASPKMERIFVKHLNRAIDRGVL